VETGQHVLASVLLYFVEEDMSMSKTITYERARALLGDIDYLTLSRIVATGASEKELERAVHQVERGDQEGEPVPPLRDGAVARVSAILRELSEEEIERDYEVATD
jgi:hypothetical protein